MRPLAIGGRMPDVTLKPVAKTAYCCCGARAADAESRRPICGDNLARLFMNEEAESVFAHFRGRRLGAAPAVQRRHSMSALENQLIIRAGRNGREAVEAAEQIRDKPNLMNFA